MKRIAIDMDEVIADALAEHLQRYNTDFNAKLTKQDVIGKRIAELAPPEHLSRLRSYFHEESFFRDLDVMEGSQEVISDLMDRYEVYIVTAAMEVPCSFTAKFQWLERHFPFLPPDNIVFCGNKGIIAADYLIDDNVYQLDRFRGEASCLRRRTISTNRNTSEWTTGRTCGNCSWICPKCASGCAEFGLR